MKKFPKGFTLIEMMLVIALAAVLATIGISAYQKRAEQAKIDKSALQIQQLLQAGMAYYVSYGCWPESNSINSLCAKKPPPDFTPFRPAGGSVNPWGYDYTFGNANTGKLFSVRGRLADKSLAARLAAKLPNATVATVDNVVYSVIAEVGIPGSVVTGSGVSIHSMGYIFNNGSVTVPYSDQPGGCPVGTRPRIYSSVSGFTATMDDRQVYHLAMPPNAIVIVTKPDVGLDPGNASTWETNVEFTGITGKKAEEISQIGKPTFNRGPALVAIQYMVLCCTPQSTDPRKFCYYQPPITANTY